jgi:two-component system, OmpR family, sensor histidine kinase BaeS
MKINLRNRLLLGHIVPVLVSVPLMGLALIFLLDTRIFIPHLAKEMMAQGQLLVEVAIKNPEVFKNIEVSQRFLDAIKPQTPTRFAVLTTESILLSATDLSDQRQVGFELVNLPKPKTKDPTEIRWAVTPDYLNNPQLDVIIPVVDYRGRLMGFVQVSRRLADINQALTKGLLVILAVLLGGLLMSGLIAVFLAESFSRPLKVLTEAISTAPLQGKAQSLDGSEIREINFLIQSFNQLQGRRYELEQQRQKIVTNIVHELGRPLGSLHVALEAFQAGADQDAALRSQLLNGMVNRANHMGLLLEDLTQAFISPVMFRLAPIVVELGFWLEEQLPLWSEEAHAHRLNWKTDIRIDHAEVIVDPDRLAQALGNLVSNALHYTPPGGTILLRADLQGQLLTIRVTDTGPGIPPEEQARIFEPFYRYEHPSWKTEGLGLGLPIARSIIQAMGGDLTVQSQPGEGSTFTLVVHVEVNARSGGHEPLPSIDLNGS